MEFFQPHDEIHQNRPAALTPTLRIPFPEMLLYWVLFYFVLLVCLVLNMDPRHWLKVVIAIVFVCGRCCKTLGCWFRVNLYKTCKLTFTSGEKYAFNGASLFMHEGTMWLLAARWLALPIAWDLLTVFLFEIEKEIRRLRIRRCFVENNTAQNERLTQYSATTILR